MKIYCLTPSIIAIILFCCSFLEGCASRAKEEKLPATIVQVWEDKGAFGYSTTYTTVKTIDGEIGQLSGNLGKEGDKIIVYRITNANGLFGPFPNGIRQNQ